MPFVIEKDMGEGKSPMFWNDKGWGSLEDAVNYDTEEFAQSEADKRDGDCIVMPNNVVVFSGTSEKSAEVLNNMKLDTKTDE